MNMLENQTILLFQEKIRKRWETHRRDLPWRNTSDPYAIRISESMLCQTQVNRVIDYYHKRLEKFPTVQDLANASNEDVLRMWSGLGYNSRALRLKQAAIEIQKSNCTIGDYMENYHNLIILPGVGDYIANAVLAFAHNQNVIVMDTNIRRIMIHEFSEKLGRIEKNGERWGKMEKDGERWGKMEKDGERWGKMEKDGEKWGKMEKNGERLVKSLIRESLPKGKARDRYNALMDYGALEVTARKSGIAPSTKQTKFSGSTRQVRAGIIRTILESPAGCITFNTIEKHYGERDDVDQIISKMIQEKLITPSIYGYTLL